MREATRPRTEVAAVRVIARLARLAERELGGQLSLAQYRILCAVAAGDQRASRVAAKLSLGKPTVSAAVDTLCRRGLLTRSAVDGDQRATALALTAQGRAVLEHADQSLVAALRELSADDELLTVLAGLDGALEAQAQARSSARASAR